MNLVTFPEVRIFKEWFFFLLLMLIPHPPPPPLISSFRPMLLNVVFRGSTNAVKGGVLQELRGPDQMKQNQGSLSFL